MDYNFWDDRTHELEINPCEGCMDYQNEECISNGGCATVNDDKQEAREMKKAYAITVKEVLERTVCVYADDLDDAINKVETAYKKCDIVLNSDDFCGYPDINPSYYAPVGGEITDIVDEYEDYQWIGEIESEEM